jgi:hypothetical protein
MDRKIVVTHKGNGIKEIDKISKDALHTFQDGGVHINKSDGRKLQIKELTGNGKIKDLGGYF